MASPRWSTWGVITKTAGEWGWNVIAHPVELRLSNMYQRPTRKSSGHQGDGEWMPGGTKGAWRVMGKKAEDNPRMALEGNGSSRTNGQTVTTNLAAESTSG